MIYPLECWYSVNVPLTEYSLFVWHVPSEFADRSMSEDVALLIRVTTPQLS